MYIKINVQEKEVEEVCGGIHMGQLKLRWRK